MIKTHLAAALALVALVGCGDDGVGPDASPHVDAGPDHDGGSDAGPRDAGTTDGGTRDAGRLDGGATDAGSSDGGSCPAPAIPSGRLGPAAGELFYAQIGLGGFSLGESALIVGPDGTTVLVDVGNDAHDDDVADVLTEYTGDSDVDHIVVTHFHADHGDGIEDLLGRVRWTGRLVHRGFTDYTPAAGETSLERVCTAARSREGANAALCTADAEPGSCDPTTWSEPHPATSCAGLEAHDLALGAGARLDFFAANGVIGDASHERDVGPFLRDDTNGENARSVVALLAHGAFRMLLDGDLTGGGSDTDDVEGFYVPHLEAVAGIDARGVDVLHAGHHGRNTSTSVPWADRLLPRDGLARNVIMGVSTAHVGSPHREVLDVIFAGDRLAGGNAWTTRVTATGATAEGLRNAEGGLILLATLEGGAAYAIQIVDGSGAVRDTRTFRSVAGCP